MQYSFHLLTILALAFLSLSVGCAQKIEHKPVDPAIVKLNETASDIRQSLVSLEKIKQSKKDNEDKDDVHSLPKDSRLNKKISLNWSGPMSIAVETIADKVGYDFNETGQEPAQPIIIDVQEYEVPAFRLLEDIGMQAKDRADLMVSDEENIVQINY